MTLLLYFITLLLIFTNFYMPIAIWATINDCDDIDDCSLLVAFISGTINMAETVWLCNNQDIKHVGLTFLLQVGILIININLFNKADYKHNVKPYLQIKL